MIDLVLHTGAEHPSLLWIVVPSLLTFLAGLAIGSFSTRVREWLSPDATPASD